MKPSYRLIQGDNRDVLPSLEDESIDCVVTDPQYGISFMGKSWDKALPDKKSFQEIFRVLKHGAVAFVMASPRQDVLWRMLRMLEECGFELRQSFLSWVYASGFPKAYDISKGIDKKLGKKRETVGRRPAFPDGTRGATRISASQGTPTDYGRYGDLNIEKGMIEVSAPACEESRRWSGWKSVTGLKPALEVIIMAQKPRKGSIVDNVLEFGVGGLNVDATRIPFRETQSPSANRWGGNTPRKSGNPIVSPFKGKNGYVDPTQGRFPANLLVSDNILDTKIEKGTGHFNKKATTSGYEGGLGEYEREVRYLNDVGGFSRFFSLDAWWTERVKRLPVEVQRTFPFLEVPKASKAEREEGLQGMKNQRHLQGLDTRGRTLIREDGSKTLVERWQGQGKNVHPTVKPLKLMMYLVELGCPEGGTLLDPFLGSGTTMKAAILSGKSCIGIEIEPEYCRIAEARCFNKMLLDAYSLDYKVETL